MKRPVIAHLFTLIFTVMLAVSCGGGGETATGYIVTFAVNGADNDLEKITGLQDGDTLTTPDVIEKTGNLFDGWYSTENFDAGTLWIFGDEGTEVTGNTTLYAKWIECSPVTCFTFTETESAATITGLTVSGEAVENLVIPLDYNGKALTTININGVAYSTMLKKLTIGKSVTTINTPLFQNCINITEIHVVEENNSFTAIDGVLFNKSADTIVMYPQGKPDTSYTITGNITNIAAGAFHEAKNLTAVTIINPEITFGMNIFNSCTNLANVTLPEGLTALGRGLFVKCTSLESVNIPDSVEVLPLDLFNYCSSLTAFNIPAQIREIQDYAFSGTSIETIDIPATVTTIGTGAFANDSLTSINVSADNANYSSDAGVLFNKTKTILYLYPRGNAGTSYTIPSTVVTIEADAFYHADKLTEVVFPEGLITIKGLAFYECTSLQSVILPSTLTDITFRVFESCSQLKQVEVKSSTPPIGCYRGFWGTHSELKIYVPTASVTSYKTTDYWSTYVDKIYDVAEMP